MTVAAKPHVELSVVATLYQSESSVAEFCRRAAAAAQLVTADYEIVLVNDGSRDGSLAAARLAQRHDPRIKVVDLSRNFGHHLAMMEGLRHAQGRRIFLIDSDLEDDPADLGKFAQQLDGSDADVVYGVQAARQGGLFKRVTGAAFYRLFNWLSPVRLPPNLVTTRLMTRRYVDALIQYRERELFMAGVWVVTGFKQVPLLITRRARPVSNYTVAGRVDHTVTAITSFTNKPLILVFYVGVTIFMAASAAAAYLVWQRLWYGKLLAGWASLIVSVWMLGGATIAAIGVLGVYLSRVFSEVKQRPAVIVRAIYEEEIKNKE